MPGQSEIFGTEIMTEMQKKALLDKATKPGRKITYYNGHQRAIESFKPQDVLVHDWVSECVEAASTMQQMMKDAKKKDFVEFDLIRDLIVEHYGARVGGTRGGAELETLDSLRKVQITIVDQKNVAPAIIAAEALVREVMDDLMDGASAGLRQIVDQAFVRNQLTGQMSTSRILRLVTLDINHPKWPAAQRALRDAIKNVAPRRYMRFYTRETPREAWQLIDLNYSSLEV